MTKTRIGVLLLAAAFVTGAIWAYVTGAITTESIRAWLESLGAAGPLLLILAFAGGSMVGLPGVVFVIAGRIAFGPVVGFAVGYVGGMISTGLPFLLARRLRREPIEMKLPKLILRLVKLVETHPLRAVIIARFLVWYSPTAAYALALGSRIQTRTYLVGCAISLVPVTAAVCYFTGFFT